MTIQNRIYKSQIQGLQEAETTAGPFDNPKYKPGQWGPYERWWGHPSDYNRIKPSARPGWWNLDRFTPQWKPPGPNAPTVSPKPPTPKPPLNLSGKDLLAWLIRFFMRAGFTLAVAQKLANQYMENNPISNPQELDPSGNPLPPGDHQQSPVPWGNPQG